MPGDYSNSNHTLTLKGDLQSQGGELVFPGAATEIIQVADSADWVFSGVFTVELFKVKFDSDTIRQDLIAQYNTTGNQRSFGFEYRGDLSPKTFRLVVSTDGSGVTSITTPEFNITVGQAYDLTFERDGSDVVRIYAGGSMIHSATFAGALHNSTDPLKIGLGVSSAPFDGRLAAVRITKAARYADDNGYTVPDLPLPTSA